MKALVQEDNSKKLYIGKFEDPVIGNDDLLIEVKATAVNRADLIQKKGLYDPPKGASPIIGLEVAGIIVEVGKNVSGWNLGDRVFSILPGGGYAELVSLPSDMAMKIPDNLSFIEAAAIPEAFLTAFFNMQLLGNLEAHESVLIHAGASSVGSAAIQLAKVLQSKTIVTAGSQKKLDFCYSIGADTAINYKHESFSNVVLQKTNNEGVQMVLDLIGASYWEDNMKSLSQNARWLIIGVLGGVETTVNLREIMRKHIKIIGSTLRTRSEESKADLVQSFSIHALPLFYQGKLNPVIDSVFNWDKVNEAHQHMESSNNIGKIVLEVD
ncbi:NAD(P)H-quinone oxidoreductase [Virgibacillus natechei]|uniref:NAD(P)H-quinone oxidoreductase n=1 Tax=Virgibacillus sp. CBA3643 TaxID=2942278 RepID=UPI0035A337EA